MLKTKNRLILPGVVLCASILLAASQNAWAVYSGNPSHSFKSGDFGVGAALTDDREEVFFDLGLSEAGVLDVYYGLIDFEDNPVQDGTYFGAGYRHNLNREFDFQDWTIDLGILASFRTGTYNQPLAPGDFEFDQINLGFGGSVTLFEGFQLYAAAVYERFKEDKLTAFGKLSVTSSEFGPKAGVEFLIGETFVVGAEVNPTLFTDEVIVHGLVKF